MYHLICVHPFHGYTKGQMITEQDEVTRLLADRENHFAKIMAPPVPEEAAPAFAPPTFI